MFALLVILQRHRKLYREYRRLSTGHSLSSTRRQQPKPSGSSNVGTNQGEGGPSGRVHSDHELLTDEGDIENVPCANDEDEM